MNFAERLKELREEKKITQRELAHYLGLTANSIGAWEKNRSEPSINSLLKMSNLFEVPVGYLLGQLDDFGQITIRSDNSFNTTPTEQRLILDFRKLPEDTQSHFAALFHNLATSA